VERRTHYVAYYPDVKDDYFIPLMTIMMSYRKDPDYLGRDCPYSAQAISFLTSLASGETGGMVEEYLGHRLDKWSAVERESLALYEELRQVGDALDGDDTTAALQTIKTKTQLLDKLSQIGERAKWMKQLHTFNTIVLNAMETHMSPDQRSDIMAKLRNTLTQGEDI
jgi:hypothetical protein